MNKGIVPAMALLLALAATFVQAIVLPQRTVACRCAPPQALKEVVEQGPDNIAILIGSIGAAQPEMTPIAVEAWFFGARPAGMVWISGGSRMASSCDRTLGPGQRHLLVLHGQPGQVYSTTMCDPGGQLGTLEGDALLADALALFGDPQAPATPEPVPERPVDFTPLLDGAMGWVVAGVIAAALLFAATALVGRRRPLS